MLSIAVPFVELEVGSNLDVLSLRTFLQIRAIVGLDDLLSIQTRHRLASAVSLTWELCVWFVSLFPDYLFSYFGKRRTNTNMNVF